MRQEQIYIPMATSQTYNDPHRWSLSLSLSFSTPKEKEDRSTDKFGAQGERVDEKLAGRRQPRGSRAVREQVSRAPVRSGEGR